MKAIGTSLTGSSRRFSPGSGDIGICIRGHRPLRTPHRGCAILSRLRGRLVTSKIWPSKLSEARFNPPLHRTKLHRTTSSGKLYSTTTNIITMEPVDQILTPALLGELQKLWFKHILNEDDMVVPCQESMMKWFKKDEAFDKTCS